MTYSFGGMKRVFMHPNNRNQFVKTASKVMWWLINRRFFKYPVVAEMVPGVKLLCYPDSSYGSLVIYTGIPEYDEQMFMYTSVRPSDIVFDIGAHIGSETVLLGSRLKSGKVYAFEPTAHIAQELRVNIGLNNLQQIVEPIESAVSDRDGKLTFYMSKSSETNGLTEASGTQAVSVSSVTLDRFCRTHKVHKINILKMDVEGAEIRVIKGAKHLLSHHLVEIIVFEVNDQGGRTKKDNQEVQKILLEYGYTLYIVNNNSRLNAYKPENYDGIVHNVIALSPQLTTNKRKELFV